jgi:hypothetical protein
VAEQEDPVGDPQLGGHRLDLAAQRAVAGQDHAQPGLGARRDRERPELGRVVLLLDEPAHAPDQHRARIGADPRPQRRDVLRSDRAVGREIDAVADRAHPPAEPAVHRAGQRTGGLGGEPAEPLAELVGHRHHVAHQLAHHLVAQRLLAAAVGQLLRQERVRAIGHLAGERAQRADRGADPEQARRQAGDQERPRVDRVDHLDLVAPDQLGHPPHVVGPQAGRERQDLDRDRALAQPRDQLARLLAERAEHRPVPRGIEVERQVDDALGPSGQAHRVHDVQHGFCAVGVHAVNHCSYQPKRLIRHHRSYE